jgi:uncharacterized LabA/DUF88 family protein
MPGNGAAFAHAPNAALLIDFDNVTMGIRSDLQAELRSLLSSDIIKGKVAVQRAYADWRRYPQYIVPLTESSIDLIFAPAYGSSKKNATDIRLAIDALELVFTRPEIGTFILLSGDSDFSSLVIKLKEYGKYIIGVGIRESSSDLLVMNCDEYYSYNALAGLVKSGEEESTRWDPWQLVTEALTRMKRNGDVMRSDRLKQVMQEIDSSFDEKDLGHPKFSRFVQEAAHKGLIKVSKLESGQLEIDTPNGEMPPPIAGTPSAAVEGETAPAAEARRERDRDRDRDRGGRRGRRGRGRDRDRDEPRHATSGDAASEGDDIESAAAAEATVEEMPTSTETSPVNDVQPAAAVEQQEAPRGREQAESRGPRDRGGRPDRSERNDRDRGRPRDESQESFGFGTPLFVAIGVSGERLTRSEAFDLVRRAVESLVSGEETTSASAVRRRAFELLGRDSESLSERGFERILRDAHDAEMIDLRRRGNDFEVARAVDAAPIVEQLKTAEDTHKAIAAANAPPPPPRGMAPRGVGGKSSFGSRGRGSAEVPADLLMVGVVGAAPAAKAPVEAPKVETPAAAETPSIAASEPTAAAASTKQETASASVAEPETAEAPARKRGRPAAKEAAKAPAKVAAKKATKTAGAAKNKVAEAAPAPAKKAAKKAAKAPAKRAKAKG